MKKIIIVFLFVVSSNFISGQALQSLSFQYSPLYLGTGSVGVSNHSDKVSGFYFNPAVLGYFGKENHVSLFSLAGKDYSVPEFHLTQTMYGGSFGYNLQKCSLHLPLSVGVGFLHNKYNYLGFLPIMESYDLFDELSVGLGFDYYFNFSVGIAVKRVKSHIELFWDTLPPTAEANVTVYDYGMFVNAPFTKLFLSNLKYNLNSNSYIFPTSDLSFGVALQNYGKNVWYIDEDQSDLLPRAAMMGITFNLGASMKIDGNIFNLVNYSFSSETNDPSVVSDETGTKYQTPFSDLEFVNNIIKLNYDNNVIVHKGHIFSLFETIKITSGNTNRSLAGSEFNKSNGFSISSNGLFKLFYLLTNNNIAHFISKHFEANYYDYRVYFDETNYNEFQSFAFTVKGF